MLLFGKQGRAGMIGSKMRKFNKCGSYYKQILIGFTFMFFFYGGLMKLTTTRINRLPCAPPSIQAFSPDSKDKPHCLPIKATSNLIDTSDGEVHGKFMEKLDPPRKRMTFLVEPRDITSLPESCRQFQDQVKWKIIFVVKSALNNFKRRAAIRETWGALKFYQSAMIKVVFLVGTEASDELQKKLTREIDQHHDILQLQLMDFSRTVPEKVLAGMQWSSERLKPDWVYASLDDDIAIFMPNLIQYLNSLFEPAYSNLTKFNNAPCYQDLPVVCVNKIKIRDAPERKSFSKWYVSREEFPGDTWPTYCRGGLYLISNKLASEMYEISRTTDYLSMDDVWITGFMRRQLGVGDCNIMGSPYSGASDTWIWNFFYDSGGDKAFMKHLWGNIAGWKVDVSQLQHQEWEGWKKRVNFNEGCTVTS